MFGELETFRLRYRSAQGDRSDCHSERRRSRGISTVGRAWTRAGRNGGYSALSRCLDFGPAALRSTW